MSTFLICLFPLVYTAVLLIIGYYVGRNGLPVRWVGFQRRKHVAKQYE